MAGFVEVAFQWTFLWTFLTFLILILTGDGGGAVNMLVDNNEYPDGKCPNAPACLDEELYCPVSPFSASIHADRKFH